MGDVEVEVDQFRDGVADRQAGGNDGAGGRAADQGDVVAEEEIEILSRRKTGLQEGFDAFEEGEGDDAADAPAIEGKDALRAGVEEVMVTECGRAHQCIASRQRWWLAAKSFVLGCSGPRTRRAASRARR